jgi:hypothetical protein
LSSTNHTKTWGELKCSGREVVPAPLVHVVVMWCWKKVMWFCLYLLGICSRKDLCTWCLVYWFLFLARCLSVFCYPRILTEWFIKTLHSKRILLFFIFINPKFKNEFSKYKDLFLNRFQVNTNKTTLLFFNITWQIHDFFSMWSVFL